MKLQNGSQVATRPAADTTSGSPGYFSTSNDKGEPSYPGKDWFNNIIDELLNGINAAGVTYDSSKLTNLASAMSAVRDASNLNAGTIPLARLPTGAGKKFDADLLDGEEGSYYRDASNLNAGTVPLARLPIKLATTEEIAAGISDSVYITPKGLTEAGVFADFVSSVHFFATNIPPAGFIKSNDTLLLIEDFPELYAKFGTAYGGDGITTFGNFDCRGEFVRALDDGRGVDVDRILGSWQEDEFKSHQHVMSSVPTTYSVYDGAIDGSYNAGGADRNYTNRNTNAKGGAETRPRNKALIAYIKY